MLSRLKQLIFGESDADKAMRLCNCVCWCPKCSAVLNVRAAHVEAIGGEVHYVCWCGHRSRWSFGEPVPILLSRRDNG